MTNCCLVTLLSTYYLNEESKYFTWNAESVSIEIRISDPSRVNSNEVSISERDDTDRLRKKYCILFFLIIFSIKSKNPTSHLKS